MFPPTVEKATDYNEKNEGVLVVVQDVLSHDFDQTMKNVTDRAIQNL